VTIAGNIENCRTEAEVRDESYNLVGVVYEDENGWHKELIDESVGEASVEIGAVFSEAIHALSHYVNRRGENPPEDSSVGILALWLMIKDDGTAMGQQIHLSK
jgi:hypothetical protein